MKLFKMSILIIALLSLMTCQQNKKEIKKDSVKETTNVKEAVKSDAEKKENVKKSGEGQKEADAKNEKKSEADDESTYGLKDNGLYVYADGPDIKLWHNQRCFEYLQKNYKYIKVPVQDEQTGKKEIYGLCPVIKSCITDLGKPSLFELGYDRHREREIKPEDNRFGVNVTKEVKWKAREKTLTEQYDYKYILKDKFIKMTHNEFISNGIVILGKNISRVLIKKPLTMPFVYDKNKVIVEFTYHYFGCHDHKYEKTVYAPIIANFRRIDLKENIFEFVKEEPLPSNASYLTDEQFIELSENVYQLIPRQIDKTLNPVTFHHYWQGFYLVEYYEGNKLVAWHGLQIDGIGKKPAYWAPLKIKNP